MIGVDTSAVSPVLRDRLQRIATRALLRCDDEALGACIVVMTEPVIECRVVAALVAAWCNATSSDAMARAQR